MLTGCDAAAPRVGTVRTLCLLVIAFGLIVLYATSYVDRYKQEICADRVSQALRQRQQQGTRRHDNEDVDEEDEIEKKTMRRKKVTLRDNEDDDDDEREKSADSIRRANQTMSAAASAPAVAVASLPAPAAWDYDWDSSAGDVSSDAERKNIADRTLLLIRHGQYDLQTEQLTELGRQQAQMTGERLRLANLSYSEIIHSTMDRAAETARIIHRCLGGRIPIRADEMLVEGGPIPPQPTITYWGLPQKTYHQDGPRMEAAFRKYFHRGDSGLRRESFQILVGHGNIFRFFALRSLQLSKDAWMRVFIAHASITTLHIRSDGTVSMTKFGDSGHFPIDKVTY